MEILPTLPNTHSHPVIRKMAGCFYGFLRNSTIFHFIFLFLLKNRFRCGIVTVLYFKQNYRGMFNMKRSVLIILCLLLSVALFGCGQSASDEGVETLPTATEPAVIDLPEDFTFAENIRAAGIDVGGLTISQAYDVICEKAAHYILTADINENLLFFTGEDLDLYCNKEALVAYAAAVYAGKSGKDIRLIRYDEDALSSYIFNAVNTPAQNASVVFNSETALFELVAGKDGLLADMDAVTYDVDAAIQRLKQQISIDAPLQPYAPQIGESSPVAKAALEKANDYVTTEITYSFDDGEDIHLVTLTAEQIAPMVGFKSDLTPYIKSEPLREYVNELNKQYGMTGVEGAFKATGGAQTDLTVTYYAPYVDADALYEEILDYLEKGISGTRLPPRLDNLVPQEMPFKGNYIEVDLTGQTLYLYKDTECIMETPIVTGCISRYMNTPTGVYSVLTRRMHVILKGEDYETYVKYWMQFRGGYGLHDAYWRYRFGGNEYLYNGSHGCVNIPPDNAAFLFEHIYVGYPVVLYGGASNSGPLQQEILGTEEYNISIHAKPFQLDTKTAAGNGKLTYTSSNSAVASVTEDGTVTIHKTGSAVISVEYEESRYYTAASLRVKINVDDPCGDQHTFGPWEITEEPTCVTGVQTRACTRCDMEESKAVAAASSHTYGQWEVTNEPDCEDGLEQKVCSVCGHTLNRTLPAEHSLRDWKVRQKPTCEEPGEHYRACRWCDYEETEVLPALGHSFSPDEEFCEMCDAPNPDWIPPTEPKKKEEEE